MCAPPLPVHGTYQLLGCRCRNIAVAVGCCIHRSHVVLKPFCIIPPCSRLLAYVLISQRGILMLWPAEKWPNWSVQPFRLLATLLNSSQAVHAHCSVCCICVVFSNFIFFSSCELFLNAVRNCKFVVFFHLFVSFGVILFVILFFAAIVASVWYEFWIQLSECVFLVMFLKFHTTMLHE